MLKRFALAVAGLFMSMIGVAAHAAIDTTAVTTGITDAQTAIIAIVTALLALSTAIFGIVKVYRFVSKKSGA